MPQLPKRLFKAATIGRTAGGLTVLLDGKPVRTPGGVELSVPRKTIAEGLVAEWQAQVEVINPASMPLTRLVNSAIDAVAGQEGEVAADAAKYAASDLVCYRADAPPGLVALQKKSWDPILEWAEQSHGWHFATVAGVMPKAQPEAALRGVAEATRRLDTFRLAGLHSATTLMGSVLLALAVAEERLSPEAAWNAAHVDENWQISQWGEDQEARTRRDFRWREMRAADLLLAPGPNGGS